MKTLTFLCDIMWWFCCYSRGCVGSVATCTILSDPVAFFLCSWQRPDWQRRKRALLLFFRVLGKDSNISIHFRPVSMIFCVRVTHKTCRSAGTMCWQILCSNNANTRFDTGIKTHIHTHTTTSPIYSATGNCGIFAFPGKVVLLKCMHAVKSLVSFFLVDAGAVFVTCVRSPSLLILSRCKSSLYNLCEISIFAYS